MYYTSIQDFLLANKFTYSHEANIFQRGETIILAEELTGKSLSYFEERYMLVPSPVEEIKETKGNVEFDLNVYMNGLLLLQNQGLVKAEDWFASCGLDLFNFSNESQDVVSADCPPNCPFCFQDREEAKNTETNIAKLIHEKMNKWAQSPQGRKILRGIRTGN